MSRLYTVVLTIMLLVSSCVVYAAGANQAMLPILVEEAKFVAKVEGRDFFVYTNGKWEKKFLKGVKGKGLLIGSNIAVRSTSK